MDITTIGGIVLAIVCILGGQALEGGHAGSLVQATAFIIVIGGTIGATMVAFPRKDFMRGVKMAKAALTDAKPSGDNGFKIELAQRIIVRALTLAAAGTPDRMPALPASPFSSLAGAHA